MKKILLLLSLSFGMSGQVVQKFLNPTSVKSANYSIQCKEFVPCNASASSFTITLPNAPTDGCLVGVKSISVSGTYSVVIKRSGSDVFNIASGSTTIALSLLNQGVILEYRSGGIWYVLSDDAPQSSLAGTYWAVRGNTVSTDSSDYVGTNNAKPFLLKTNGSERLKVYSGGGLKNTGILNSTGSSTFGTSANSNTLNIYCGSDDNGLISFRPLVGSTTQMAKGQIGRAHV